MTNAVCIDRSGCTKNIYLLTIVARPLCKSDSALSYVSILALCIGLMNLVLSFGIVSTRFLLKIHATVVGFCPNLLDVNVSPSQSPIFT